MKNYKMVTGEDGIVWVTIQPLMYEVKKYLNNAKNISTDELDHSEKRGVDFTILSMEAVYNFLSSLMTEHTVENIAQNDEENRTVH